MVSWNLWEPALPWPVLQVMRLIKGEWGAPPQDLGAGARMALSLGLSYGWPAGALHGLSWCFVLECSAPSSKAGGRGAGGGRDWSLPTEEHLRDSPTEGWTGNCIHVEIWMGRGRLKCMPVTSRTSRHSRRSGRCGLSLLPDSSTRANSLPPVQSPAFKAPGHLTLTLTPLHREE